jgi:N2227-like protein
MNMAYRYITTTQVPHTSRFYPFIGWWSHQVSPVKLQRPVLFPDTGVGASSVLLAEGDFTTVFRESTAEYDVVITLFFIDTAGNIMQYLETISRMLKPGGIWMNLGPLVWQPESGLQFTLEELAAVCEAKGFQFIQTKDKWGELTIPGKEIRGKEAGYTFDKQSLWKNAYLAQFWVVRNNQDKEDQ